MVTLLADGVVVTAPEAESADELTVVGSTDMDRRSSEALMGAFFVEWPRRNFPSAGPLPIIS